MGVEDGVVHDGPAMMLRYGLKEVVVGFLIEGGGEVMLQLENVCGLIAVALRAWLWLN